MLHIQEQENSCCYDGAHVYSKVVTTYKVSIGGRLTVNVFQVRNKITLKIEERFRLCVAHFVVARE